MKIKSFILMLIAIVGICNGLLNENLAMICGGFASGLLGCLWQYVRTHENGSN